MTTPEVTLHSAVYIVDLWITESAHVKWIREAVESQQHARRAELGLTMCVSSYDGRVVVGGCAK